MQLERSLSDLAICVNADHRRRHERLSVPIQKQAVDKRWRHFSTATTCKWLNRCGARCARLTAQTLRVALRWYSSISRPGKNIRV
jgi:hypothetical protein